IDPIASVPAHADGVSALASLDGRRFLLTSSPQGTVRFWKEGCLGPAQKDTTNHYNIPKSGCRSVSLLEEGGVIWVLLGRENGEIVVLKESQEGLVEVWKSVQSKVGGKLCGVTWGPDSSSFVANHAKGQRIKNSLGRSSLYVRTGSEQEGGMDYTPSDSPRPEDSPTLCPHPTEFLVAELVLRAATFYHEQAGKWIGLTSAERIVTRKRRDQLCFSDHLPGASSVAFFLCPTENGLPIARILVGSRTGELYLLNCETLEVILRQK
ncbi:unnamed protein product, partial [Cyprideis torosa]